MAYVWVGGARFATPENIKEGIIKFKVERKWLADNNFAGADISMLRWDGSNWIALGTQVERRDDNFTYLEAATNTFSPFASAEREDERSSSLNLRQPQYRSENNRCYQKTRISRTIG